MSSSGEKNEPITIGKIVGVHGLAGTFKVSPDADTLTFFDSGREIFILWPQKAVRRSFEVNWSKPHNRLVLLNLKGIDDRTQAEKLIGSDIVIDRASLPKLDNGTYYWHDLFGMDVYSSEGVYLGKLETVIPTGSNDVYVVKRPPDAPDEEILIPALNSVVLEIDVESRIMRVELPEGL